jgi:hypothetical protein
VVDGFLSAEKEDMTSLSGGRYAPDEFAVSPLQNAGKYPQNRLHTAA